MATGRRPALGKSICLHCGQSFGVRGLFNHEKACRNREELEEPNPVVDPDSVDPEPNEESTRCKYLGQKLYLIFISQVTWYLPPRSLRSLRILVQKRLKDRRNPSKLAGVVSVISSMAR